MRRPSVNQTGIVLRNKEDPFPWSWRYSLGLNTLGDPSSPLGSRPLWDGRGLAGGSGDVEG